MGEYRTPLPFRFGARLRLGKVVDRGSEPPENLPSVLVQSPMRP